MKKYIAALMVVALLFTVALPRQEARAEVMTLTIIGGAAVAVAAAAGLTYASTGMTAQQFKEYITNRLNRHIGSQGLTSWLAGEYIRLETGKLVIPAQLYNKIKTFLNAEIAELGIDSTAKNIGVGMNGDASIYSYADYTSGRVRTIAFAGGGNAFDAAVNSSGLSVLFNEETNKMTVYWYGTQVGTMTGGRSYHEYTGYILYRNNQAQTNTGVIMWVYNTGGTSENLYVSLGSRMGSTNYELTAKTDNYDDGSLNDLQQWEGEVLDAPDTNIGDLIDDIYDKGKDGEIDIEDEVVDIPDAPIPSTEPVPTPGASDIPGQLDGIQEGLNDLIGTQNGIIEGVEGIAGTVEGIQEGVGTISEAAGSIAEALDIPTAAEAPQLQLPDLRTLFPFCIPFDIYNIITAFNALPVAPRVQIPFNIPAVGLQYTFDLDFSAFNGVASVLRTLEFVAYAVGLAILTSKVIRW